MLVVGAGNSGAEIALDVAHSHDDVAWPDATPAMCRSTSTAWPARLLLVRLVLRVVFHRILRSPTPMGRRVRLKMLHGGGPLVRTKPTQLTAAGIERVCLAWPASSGGKPVLEDGRMLDVANVVWCTGFHPGFSWIDLPVFGADGCPSTRAAIVAQRARPLFVGLHFLYAMSPR